MAVFAPNLIPIGRFCSFRGNRIKTESPRGSKDFGKSKGSGIARPFLMGEEKPDEELMGKRKSSPRLSSASIQGINADILMMSRLKKNIHAFQKNFGMIFQRTFRCGTIKLCDKHDAASAVRLVDPFGRIAVPEGIKLRCMRSDANVAQLSVHPIERFQGVQRL